MLIFGSAFLVGIIVLNYESYIFEATKNMIYWELNNDNSFCQVLEPMLNCRVRVNVTEIFLRLNSNASMPFHFIRQIHPKSFPPAIDHFGNLDAIELLCKNIRQKVFFSYFKMRFLKKKLIFF